MCDKKKGIHYNLENRKKRVSAEPDDVQICRGNDTLRCLHGRVYVYPAKGLSAKVGKL